MRPTKRNHKSGTETPLVSVVLPAYNAERYIELAVTSILQQTLVNIEVIIIDDNSTDKTLEITEHLSKNDARVKIIKNTVNEGIVCCLNKGIGIAQSNFIARMDADDISKKDRLSKQVEFLKKNPDIILLGTGVEVIDSKGKHLGFRQYPENNDEILIMLKHKSPFAHPTVIFHKEHVIKTGGYREKYRTGQDYDLWARLQKEGKFANINEPLLKYRIHGEQVTHKKLKEQHQSHIESRQENMGIPDYSLAERLTGKDGTLGSKYLYISQQQSQLSNRYASFIYNLRSIINSPLNPRAWKFLITLIKSSRLYDLMKYYKNRVSRYISR